MLINHPTLVLMVIPVAVGLMSGCSSDGLVPVSGRVYYKDQPLGFGSIMLQPTVGPPASGVIQPDGSFELETHGVGKGASPGLNKVRVTCFESQRPGVADSSEAGLALGRSLIPDRYTNYTSGLVVTIEPGSNKPLEITLTD